MDQSYRGERILHRQLSGSIGLAVPVNLPGFPFRKTRKKEDTAFESERSTEALGAGRHADPYAATGDIGPRYALCLDRVSEKDAFSFLCITQGCLRTCSPFSRTNTGYMILVVSCPLA